MVPIPSSTAHLNGEASHSSSSSHPYGFSTRAIHVGSEPNGETGAVIPPISLSTTYKQDGVGNFKGYEYSRSGNPNRDSFERALASLEGAKHGLAFSSGSATTSVIMSALAPGSHVVSVNDVYGGTYRYFTKVANVTQGIKVDFVEMGGEADDVEKRLRDAIRPDTALVWVETPTNPTLRLIDIDLVARVSKAIAPASKLVVDSTFMSPWFQNPISLGADIVVHSITKYINGHSDVVMGALVLDDDEWHAKLKFLQNSIGAVPSAFDCWLALRGIKTLPVRMKAHGQSALQIARYLHSHPAISEVIYPGLPTHPSFELARRQISPKAAPSKNVDVSKEGFAYGGMISFRLRSDKRDAEPSKKVLKELSIFTLAESLGGVESLIELPSLMTHASVSDEDRDKIGVTHELIRASVGLEETEDLCRDLDQALAAAGLGERKA